MISIYDNLLTSNNAFEGVLGGTIIFFSPFLVFVALLIEECAWNYLNNLKG